MSRIDQIDLASLRRRLTWALARKQDAGLDGGGSLYLACLGAAYLCCSTDEEEERLEDLFYGQAAEEQVDDADDVLSAIVMAGQVLS